MNKRIEFVIGFTLVVLLATSFVAVAQSADPWVGTWKVNLEKSTYSPGPKPTTAATVKMESWQGGLKVTIDSADAQGKPTHTEAMGMFDGKDIPVAGAAAPNTTTAYKRIDARTFEALGKVDGKPGLTTRVVVSADGKTLTATQTGTDPQGQAVKNVIVADKQ